MVLGGVCDEGYEGVYNEGIAVIPTGLEPVSSP